MRIWFIYLAEHCSLFPMIIRWMKSWFGWCSLGKYLFSNFYLSIKKGAAEGGDGMRPPYSPCWHISHRTTSCLNAHKHKHIENHKYIKPMKHCTQAPAKMIQQISTSSACKTSPNRFIRIHKHIVLYIDLNSSQKYKVSGSGECMCVYKKHSFFC